MTEKKKPFVNIYGCSMKQGMRKDSIFLSRLITFLMTPVMLPNFILGAIAYCLDQFVCFNDRRARIIRSWIIRNYLILLNVTSDGERNGSNGVTFKPTNTHPTNPTFTAFRQAYPNKSRAELRRMLAEFKKSEYGKNV